MKYTICENHTTVHGLLIQTLIRHRPPLLEGEKKSGDWDNKKSPQMAVEHNWQFLPQREVGRSYIKVVGFVSVLITSANLFSYFSTQHSKKKADHSTFTGRMGWMAHRKWKEAQQLPGTAGPGNMLGCCLIFFHFLWAIHPIRPVHMPRANIWCEMLHSYSDFPLNYSYSLLLDRNIALVPMK